MSDSAAFIGLAAVMAGTYFAAFAGCWTAQRLILRLTRCQDCGGSLHEQSEGKER